MGAVTIGADVGQRVDPTAICVAETEQRPRPVPADRAAPDYPRSDCHHLVRHLERLPLGTPYPQVAERIAAVAAGVRARAGEEPRLYVDATGVGTPLVDVLRAANPEARIVAVFFTFGDKRTPEGGELKLGKAWLVSRLQALLQSGRLHLPKTPEAEVLAKELLDYEIKVDQDGDAKFGAFKVGRHDDLVTALGLACQTDPDEGGLGMLTAPLPPEHLALNRFLDGLSEGCAHRRSRGLDCPDCGTGSGEAAAYAW